MVIAEMCKQCGSYRKHISSIFVVCDIVQNLKRLIEKHLFLSLIEVISRSNSNKFNKSFKRLGMESIIYMAPVAHT